jgi:hypothetical protein
LFSFVMLIFRVVGTTNSLLFFLHIQKMLWQLKIGKSLILSDDFL